MDARAAPQPPAVALAPPLVVAPVPVPVPAPVPEAKVSTFVFKLPERPVLAPAPVVVARVPELAMYWDDNQTPAQSMSDAKIDPIAWWAERERKFPILSPLARQYL